ncbi:hypothetical protein LEP1GSC170_1319 [Leptospira interrogans serovar Bataviae str. HAI135]|nr:hypothetical protein LEP1GSC170_1319 [Leptospira interrogans serovar Bataviae str. HAI135]
MKFKTNISANLAISSVKSGQRVFVHSAAAAPTLLIQTLVSRAKRIDQCRNDSSSHRR